MASSVAHVSSILISVRGGARRVVNEASAFGRDLVAEAADRSNLGNSAASRNATDMSIPFTLMSMPMTWALAIPISIFTSGGAAAIRAARNQHCSSCGEK